ncbi:hypothetical protein [Cupriavidus pauculus]
MPKFYPAAVNRSYATLGVPYRRGTCVPMAAAVSAGLCFGFSTAWIRRLREGKPMSYVPNEVEAAIGQYCYVFEYGARGQPWPEGVSFDVFSPGLAIKMPGLLRHCERLNLTPVDWGEQSGHGISYLLQSGHRPHLLRTFLLVAASHAVALARKNDCIALFDPNTGIVSLDAEDAFVDGRLARCLNGLSGNSSHRGIGVLELRSRR